MRLLPLPAAAAAGDGRSGVTAALSLASAPSVAVELLRGENKRHSASSFSMAALVVRSAASSLLFSTPAERDRKAQSPSSSPDIVAGDAVKEEEEGEPQLPDRLSLRRCCARRRFISALF